MFRRLASVGGFTLLSRITGFIRDVLMAAILGAGPLSDAFLVAFRLPNNFRAIFAEGAFNLAFLPRYAAMRTRDGHDAAARFANRVFSWQIVTQLVLLVAALGGMRLIISVMAPGFAAHPGQLALATSLARIAFPYLIFTVVAVQLSAMLNSIGKFAAASAWSIFLNVAMIAALFCAPFFPNAAYAAAWGVFAAGILQLLFIIWAAARSHLHLRIGRPRWAPEIKQFLLALGAATFGSASVQISLFIDNVIAKLSALRRLDCALLCRSRQPASHGQRSASLSARFCFPKCPCYWRKTIALAPMLHRIVPPHLRCSSLCHSSPPSLPCRLRSCRAYSPMARSTCRLHRFLQWP